MNTLLQFVNVYHLVELDEIWECTLLHPLSSNINKVSKISNDNKNSERVERMKLQ
jgi:hypothetical protein